MKNKYQIIEAASAEDLQKQIAKHGMTPVGGVAVTAKPDGNKWDRTYTLLVMVAGFTEEESKERAQPLVFHGDVTKTGMLSVTFGESLLTPKQYRCLLGALNGNQQIRKLLASAITE